MRLHVVTTDLWTGRHGLAFNWLGPRVEWGIEFGFGDGFRWIWRSRLPRRFGFHVGGYYVTVRDVRRHRLLFSERNRIRCRRLARVGSWQVWARETR